MADGIKLDIKKIVKPHTHHHKHPAPSTSLSSSSTNELTLTQRKNAYKRARKKLSCYLCGDIGHTKDKCMKIFDNVYKDTICYSCRQTGHASKLCPLLQSNSILGDKIKYIKSRSDIILCYNCNQYGHAVRDCMQPKVDDGYRYAECYICHTTGHLASQCTQNPHGRYGVLQTGQCHKCGSKMHLMKNCPELTADDKKNRLIECMYHCISV